MKKGLPISWIISFLGLFLCLGSVPLQAASVDEIVHDMSPVEGHVLLLSEGEYLVDLDASHRVAVGDLLAMIEPGEKITHPVSGEVIGQLTKVNGYLEVTRVASGFSYTTLVSGAAPQRGAKVRRFEGIQAYFQGEGAIAEQLFPALRSKLGQFKWTRLSQGQTPSPQSTPEKTTLFLSEGPSLKVKTLSGRKLRTYLVDDAALEGAMSANSSPGVPPAKQLVFPDGKSNLPKGIIEVRKARRSSEQWRTSMLDGAAAGMALGTFQKEQQALAIALTGEVLLHPLPLDEKLSNRSTVKTPKTVIPLRIVAFDLNGDSVDELYVTARQDDTVASFVVDFSSGQAKITHKNLSWMFNRVEVSPGKWVLAVQQPSAIKGGGGTGIFRVSAMTSKGPQLAGALKKPVRGNLFSYQLVQGEEEPYIANFNTSDKLELYNRGGVLNWSSDDRFGGSEAYLLSKKTGDEDYHYLPAPIRKGRTGELLVPMNFGQTLFRVRSYNSSHVKGMRIEAGELVEIWRTKKQNGALSDFQTVDFDQDGNANLLLLIQFSNSNILSAGKYALVGYDLPEKVQ